MDQFLNYTFGEIGEIGEIENDTFFLAPKFTI